MKVAVISKDKQQGKSSYVAMLASVYAHTQHKTVAILSDTPVSDYNDMVRVRHSDSKLKSPHVFKAMLQTSAVHGVELFDYASRVGEENVFLFNLVTSGVSGEGDELALVNRVISDINGDNSIDSPANLTLVDINGNIHSERTKAILDNMDMYLYVFNTSPKSLQHLSDFIENYDKKIVMRTFFICQKYDRNAMSVKQIAQKIGKPVANIITIPYNSCIVKESLEGTLDLLAKDIACGHAEVINLRMGLIESMQALFNSNGRKVIKEASQWYK